MSEFSLIETLRYEPNVGFIRLNLHLTRIARSARLIGFPGTEQVSSLLSEAVRNASECLRVRVAFNAKGQVDITTASLMPMSPDVTWTARIATTRLLSADRLLRIKTTRRAVYEQARAEYTLQEADEVIMLNERGEICEGTITSVFLDDGSGVLRTPPISCGLLAGVLRADLIRQCKAKVAYINLDDIKMGTLFVGNSLRGLIRTNLKQ